MVTLLPPPNRAKDDVGQYLVLWPRQVVEILLKNLLGEYDVVR